MAANLALLIAVFLSVFLPVVSFGRSTGPQPGTHIKLTPVAGNLAGITTIAHAGDDRLFLAEQAGVIRVLQDGKVLPAPFLDITSQVECCGESGFLGLAFHPGFAGNGYFYVNYTYRAPGNELRTRVSRFRVSAGNPNVADPGSESIVLEFFQPFANHNGGALAFGPDGFLYISSGDGGGGFDPQNNAQNTGVLLGKILRIDVDSTTGADCGLAPGRSYAIPAGNPFAGGPGGACDEIWAYGLRNPWRVSFDRNTGDLWIADVGQAVREEIDFQAAGSPGGLNYGWDCFEGTLRNTTNDPSPACASNPPIVAPVHEYDHSAGRCSITGGYVYRGAAIPAFQGAYFFSDFCSAEMWALRRTNGGPAVTKLTVTGVIPERPRTFGEDASGELYVASSTTVYRLDDPLAASTALVGAGQ